MTNKTKTEQSAKEKEFQKVYDSMCGMSNMLKNKHHYNLVQKPK